MRYAVTACPGVDHNQTSLESPSPDTVDYRDSAYFRFDVITLDLNATPPRAIGEFRFLARNLQDSHDPRILMVLNGFLAIEPDRH
jgi:hypothetical protein